MSDKPKAATKTEVYAALADKTGRTKKEVAAMMDALTDYIKAQIGKKGPGLFVLPGLLKVKRHKKPPQAARMGRNPKTGEEMQIAGQVLAQDGTLIADATVSIWVADPTGRYDNGSILIINCIFIRDIIIGAT
jgi:nucleoid DNA-binding protein